MNKADMTQIASFIQDNLRLSIKEREKESSYLSKYIDIHLVLTDTNGEERSISEATFEIKNQG